MTANINILKELTPPILLSALKRIKNIFLKNSDREYVIEDVRIILSSDHKLDVFQKLFSTYDKFITVIPKYLPKDSIVIDIGANIGDSAIPFLKENIKTICVEPSSYFLKYLNKNINDNNFSNLAVIIEKLISTTNSKVSLVIKNGTASIDGKINSNKFIEEVGDSISLDFLVKDFSKISFIKIDTDGFDFDVINSGRQFFVKNKPLILFENLINKINQKEYEKVYIFLEEQGYSNICVFDNKGLLILKKARWDDLRDLNNYIVNENCRGIGYTDIFCYHESDRQIGDSMVNEFIQRFM